MLWLCWCLLVGLATNAHAHARRRCPRGAVRCSEYDYVVVGAGTAGSVVAADLASKDSDSTVLLLEEGYFSNMHQVIDELGRNSEYRTEAPFNSLDADYSTVSEPGLFGRELSVSRFKVTGGNNARNQNFWNFANQNDFSRRWGDIPKWSLEEVVDVYEEIEPIATDGPLTQDISEPWMQRLIQASTDNGFALNLNGNDLRNNQQEGVRPNTYQASKVNNSYVRRRTTYTSFVESIIDTQNNLDVLIARRVDKILVKEKCRPRAGPNRQCINKAYAIEMFNRGTLRIETVYVRKELVISAGTYDTPKLLMLSGIGDCTSLENDFGIDCVADLPEVGQNLQDHLIGLIAGPPFINATQVALELPSDIAAFGEFGFGTHTYSDLGRIQYQLTIDSQSVLIPGLTDVQLYSYYTVNDLKSLGYVKLVDTNPETRPEIFHNFLSTPEDLALAIQGFKTARDLMYNTTAFDGYLLPETAEFIPGFATQTDLDIELFLRFVAIQGYHATSTCAIGKVVDNELLVYGFDNLRIADASVMPTPPSSNTNALTTVIGRRAANFILGLE